MKVLLISPPRENLQPANFPPMGLAYIGAVLQQKRPMADILKDGGIYFNPENPGSIAKAIKILIEEPKVRLRCSRRSNLYAREYSWRRCSTETFTFLKEVLNNSRNNRIYEGMN